MDSGKEMEKTAGQIQKERIKELEGKVNALIAKCDIATLTSINEKDYSRTCVLPIAKTDGFSVLIKSEPATVPVTASASCFGAIV